MRNNLKFFRSVVIAAAVFAVGTGVSFAGEVNAITDLAGEERVISDNEPAVSTYTATINVPSSGIPVYFSLQGFDAEDIDDVSVGEISDLVDLMDPGVTVYTDGNEAEVIITFAAGVEKGGAVVAAISASDEGVSSDDTEVLEIFVGTTENPVISALRWDGEETAVPASFYYNYHGSANGGTVRFAVDNVPQMVTAFNADFGSIGGGVVTLTEEPWEFEFDWTSDGVDQSTGTYEIPVEMTVFGAGVPLYDFVVVNINPIEMDMGLGGDTTDWSEQDADFDFTAAEFLEFEKVDGETSIGKLVLNEPVNLCDPATVNGLSNLGANLTIAAGKMSIDTAAEALAAFDVASTLYMYDLSFGGIPSVRYIPEEGGVHRVVDVGDIVDSGKVSYFDWNEEQETLVFSVNEWSSYQAFDTHSNMLSNWHFEDWTIEPDAGPDYWEWTHLDDRIEQTIESLVGNNAVKLELTTTDQQQLTQYGKTMAGPDETYYVSLWVKGTGVIDFGFKNPHASSWRTSEEMVIDTDEWEILTFEHTTTGQGDDGGIRIRVNYDDGEGVPSGSEIIIGAAWLGEGPAPDFPYSGTSEVSWEWGAQSSKEVHFTFTVNNPAGEGLEGYEEEDFTFEMDSAPYDLSEPFFSEFNEVGGGTYTVVFTGEEHLDEYVFDNFKVDGFLIEADSITFNTPPERRVIGLGFDYSSTLGVDGELSFRSRYWDGFALTDHTVSSFTLTMSHTDLPDPVELIEDDGGWESVSISTWIGKPPFDTDPVVFEATGEKPGTFYWRGPDTLIKPSTPAVSINSGGGAWSLENGTPVYNVALDNLESISWEPFGMSPPGADPEYSGIEVYIEGPGGYEHDEGYSVETTSADIKSDFPPLPSTGTYTVEVMFSVAEILRGVGDGTGSLEHYYEIYNVLNKTFAEIKVWQKPHYGNSEVNQAIPNDPQEGQEFTIWVSLRDENGDTIEGLGEYAFSLSPYEAAEAELIDVDDQGEGWYEITATLDGYQGENAGVDVMVLGQIVGYVEDIELQPLAVDGAQSSVERLTPPVVLVGEEDNLGLKLTVINSAGEPTTGEYDFYIDGGYAGELNFSDGVAEFYTTIPSTGDYTGIPVQVEPYAGAGPVEIGTFDVKVVEPLEIAGEISLDGETDAGFVYVGVATSPGADLIQDPVSFSTYAVPVAWPLEYEVGGLIPGVTYYLISSVYDDFEEEFLSYDYPWYIHQEKGMAKDADPVYVDTKEVEIDFELSLGLGPNPFGRPVITGEIDYDGDGDFAGKVGLALIFDTPSLGAQPVAMSTFPATGWPVEYELSGELQVGATYYLMATLCEFVDGEEVPIIEYEDPWYIYKDKFGLEEADPIYMDATKKVIDFTLDDTYDNPFGAPEITGEVSYTGDYEDDGEMNLLVGLFRGKPAITEHNAVGFSVITGTITWPVEYRIIAMQPGSIKPGDTYYLAAVMFKGELDNGGIIIDSDFPFYIYDGKLDPEDADPVVIEKSMKIDFALIEDDNPFENAFVAEANSRVSRGWDADGQEEIHYSVDLVIIDRDSAVGAGDEVRVYGPGIPEEGYSLDYRDWDGAKVFMSRRSTETYVIIEDPEEYGEMPWEYTAEVIIGGDVTRELSVLVHKFMEDFPVGVYPEPQANLREKPDRLEWAWEGSEQPFRYRVELEELAPYPWRGTWNVSGSVTGISSGLPVFNEGDYYRYRVEAYDYTGNIAESELYFSYKAPAVRLLLMAPGEEVNRFADSGKKGDAAVLLNSSFTVTAYGATWLWGVDEGFDKEVTFKVDETTVGTASASAGAAALELTLDATGYYVIEASADGVFAGTSTVKVMDMGAEQTVVSAVTNPVSPLYGENFTFTVNVRDSQGEPVSGLGAGSFNITAEENGKLTLVSVEEAGETGNYTITAKYSRPGTITIKVYVLGTLVGSIEDVDIREPDEYSEDFVDDVTGERVSRFIVSREAFDFIPELRILALTPSQEIGVLEADGKLPQGARNLFAPGKIRNYEVYDEDGNKVDDFTGVPEGSILIRFTYPVGLTRSEINNLRVVSLGAQNEWVPVPDYEVNIEEGWIQARLSSLSVYSVATFPFDDLSKVYVYPNPYKPGDAEYGDAAGGGLVIANLPGGSDIRIFSIAGELVDEFTSDPNESSFRWENAGDLASGVYILVVNYDGDSETVKFAVVK